VRPLRYFYISCWSAILSIPYVMWRKRYAEIDGAMATAKK
jgi:hypothetical protein